MTQQVKRAFKCRVHPSWVSCVQSSAALTEWKKTKELAFLAEVSSVPLQQALR